MSETAAVTRLERLLARLYRISLRALPSDLHRRWASDMMTMFGERLHDATSAGGMTATLAVGSKELTSIALAALQARVGQATGRVHRADDGQDGRDVWRTDPVPALFVPDDRRPLKFAMLGALACHFVLFMVVFPQLGTTSLVESNEQPTILQLRPLPPPPPAVPVRQVVQRSLTPLPVPDPTPEDPEPIIVPEVAHVWSEPTPAAVEFDVLPPLIVAPPAAPPEPERVRPGGGVEPPHLLRRVQPVYPMLAVRARVQCTVVLEAVIGRSGEVVDVDVLRGCSLGLNEAAADAVRQWRYTPTLLNGRPVEVVLTVTVRFELR